MTRRIIELALIGGLLTVWTPAAWAEEPGSPAKPASSTTQPAAADQKKPADPQHPRVALETSMGRVVLELDAEKAPITVRNFLQYVDAKHYDGTIFHRVIGTFMIQGGGFTAEMKEKPTLSPIKNEWNNGLKNDRGTIAMARTTLPDSATAQFFINVVDNPNLSQPISGGAGYAVFGKVVEGMDVVDRIKAVKTGSVGPHQNVPLEPVPIKSAKRL